MIHSRIAHLRRSRRRAEFRRLYLETLEDRRLLTVELVSVTPAPGPFTSGGFASENPVISANGKYVAFQSRSTDFVPGIGDANAADDVFVRNLESGITIPISVVPGGGRMGDGPSFDPAISDDGRFVAFVSAATNLVKGVTIDSDTNVYVRDRDADKDGIFDETGLGETSTTLLSIAMDGTSGDGPSGGGAAPFLGSYARRPRISGDGSAVVFGSLAPDLALDDSSQSDLNSTRPDVFRASTRGGPVTLISVNATGAGSCTFVFDTISETPSISRTGAVAFQSNCDNIVTLGTGSVDDTNLATDVFVGSGGAGATLVSINSKGTGTGDGASREAVISSNGRHVAFISKATDLVAGAVDANGFDEDIFVRDLKTGLTSLVSRSRAIASPLTTGNDASPGSFGPGTQFMSGPAMSDSGRFIVFRSTASDLLDPTDGVTDTNGVSDIFLFDRDADGDGIFDETGTTTTTLVSVNFAGTAAAAASAPGAGSFAPSISGDGRYVAFASSGEDVIPGVDGAQVYLRDMLTGVTTLISTTVSGESGGAVASAAGRSTSLSRDGARAAFVSVTLSPDLDPSTTSDENGEFADVFVGTPPPDLLYRGSGAGGFLTGFVGYLVKFEPVGPFEIGAYRSADATFDAADELLGILPFTDPDELDPPAAARGYTIGSGPDEIAMPGLTAATAVETIDDYFILFVVDHLDDVAEFDDDPFAEDNTGYFSGAYHEPGGPVFIHGRERSTPAASGDKITATSTATELTVTFRSSGSTSTRVYDLADVSGLRIRAHGGSDTIVGSDLPDFIHGGEGRDFLDGGAGDDIINGGPGPDTIFGGPGFDTIYDGSGDDIIDLGPDGGIVMATPGSDDIFIGSDAVDTIDFSLDDLEITLDLDSNAVQTVDADLNTIQLREQWENFVGSPLGNQLTLRPLPVPRTIQGGLGNDRLIIDAGGNLILDDGTKFTFPDSGLGDITYSDFETVRVINTAGRIVDDEDVGYSAPGFTQIDDPLFPQGFNGDIEFSAANSGNTASWTFSNVVPGSYAVSATWTSAEDRASSAPFTIRDGGADGTVVSQVRVNQEQPPGEFEDQGVMWRNLDLVRITGNTLTVELSDIDANDGANDAFEFVIADAVRIEPINSVIDDLPILIDDSPNQPRATPGTPTVFESTGASALGFIQEVVAFQTAIGGPDNGDSPGSQGSGARQVNWDDVGNGSATPNPLPGDFFNTTFTRGLQLHAAGDGFQVSGTAQSAAGPKFDNLNSTYDTAFGELNAGRLFTPIGNNTFDVTFFVPGSNQLASVPGFGAVFTDVDESFSSRMEFFDSAGEQLLSRFVQATPGNGSLSFLGVSFPEGAPIARVRITAGNGALLSTGSPNDVTQGGNSDLVVLDDFIYGEPVPLPAPIPSEGFSSDCSPISGSGFLGDRHTCSNGQQATWDFSSIPGTFEGQYTLSATWIPDPNLSDNVRYEIADGTTSIEAFANQQLPINDFIDGGVHWERLASISAVNGKLPKVTLSDPQGGAFMADAIRFDPAPLATIFDPQGNVVVEGTAVDLGTAAIDPITGLARLQGTFTIQNTGQAPLHIGAPQATGDGYSVELPLFPPIRGLPPGATTTIDVSFENDTLGQFAGRIDLVGISLPVYGPNSPANAIELLSHVVDDTTPPTVALVSPDPGAVFIEGTSIPVHLDAFDDIRLKSVDLLIDGLVVGSVSQAPYTATVTLPTGTTTARIGATAHDVAGNSTDAIPITVDLVVDQPPTVEIVQPFDGDGVLGGSTISVRVDLDDDVAVERVELRLNGSLFFEDTFVSAPFDATVSLPTTPGDQTIEVCARDTLGHITCDTAVITTFQQPAIDFSSIVVAPDAGLPPIVKVFQSDGTETFRFFAYEPSFIGGVRVAASDVNGDGIPDIITGAGPGSKPHVKVFDGATGTKLQSFFAYDPAFRGGVFVAAGDVSGDGNADIITGAGPGAGPHVRVFDGVTGNPVSEFFAFNPTFAGGVRIAAGDINGDGQADIITSASNGGDGSVRVFDGHSATQLQLSDPIPEHTLLHNFMPFDNSQSLVPLLGDFDGDDAGDWAVYRPATDHFYTLLSSVGTVISSFGLSDAPPLPRGLAAGDYNHDGKDDVIVGGNGGAVKIFDTADPNAPVELASFTAFPGFTGGVFVASASPPRIAIVNLPATGGTTEVNVDGVDLVVRNSGGTEHFRRPQDGLPRLRANGAANADDKLIVNLDGLFKPFIFDGGVGGNDVLRLEGDDVISTLTYNFHNESDGQILVDTGTAATITFTGLEPIEDTLNAIDRIFSFPDTADTIVLNTGDSPTDSVLRIDSNHSEVVDFLQPSGSLTIESGPNDSVDIGLGWVFDSTAVVDGKFARVFTREGLTLRMIGPHDWSNPVNPLDVNANGSVEPQDVLIVVNELNGLKYGDPNSGLLPSAASLPVFPKFFLDAKRDGFVVPLDALVIINYLNSLNGELEGEHALERPVFQLESGNSDSQLNTPLAQSVPALGAYPVGLAIRQRESLLQSRDQWFANLDAGVKGTRVIGTADQNLGWRMVASSLPENAREAKVKADLSTIVDELAEAIAEEFDGLAKGE